MGPVDEWAGTLYLDANCFIYSVEHIEPYSTVLQIMWERARDGYCSVITSELTLMETLVKPLKMGNALLENGFRALLQHANEVTLVPISLTVLENAARLRATVSIKTPDAIHAATALTVSCTRFITNDVGFQRLPALPVTLLSDFPAPDAENIP